MRNSPITIKEESYSYAMSYINQFEDDAIGVLLHDFDQEVSDYLRGRQSIQDVGRGVWYGAYVIVCLYQHVKPLDRQVIWSGDYVDNHAGNLNELYPPENNEEMDSE